MIAEPIKNRDQIYQMHSILARRDLRYGLIFRIGLNTGLKISEILLIKVKDLFDENGICRECMTATGKKGGVRKVKINNTLRHDLNAYYKEQMPAYGGYLFSSKKAKHLGRIQAYRVLKEAADFVGIANFGTESLRKTWGYWTYRISRNNIGFLMETFNHNSPSATFRYIGINPGPGDWPDSAEL